MKKANRQGDPHYQILECLKKKDYRGALPWFDALLEKNPKNTRIRLRYADTVALAGGKDEAVRQYQIVADELAETGFVIQAIAINKKIVRLDPNQSENHQKLAILSEQSSRTNIKTAVPTMAFTRPETRPTGTARIGRASGRARLATNESIHTRLLNWLRSLRWPRLPFFLSREEELTLGIFNELKLAEVRSEDEAEEEKRVAESERATGAAGETESAATSDVEPDFSTVSVQPVLSVADEEEVLQETDPVELRQREEIASGNGAAQAIEQTGFLLIDESSTATTSEPSVEEVKIAPTFAEEVPSDAETPVPEDESEEEEVVDEPIEFVIEFGADESDVVVAPDRTAAVALKGQDTDPAVHIIADDVKRSATTLVSTQVDAPAHIPLFSDLSAQEFVDIALVLDYRSVKTGMVIFKEGDPGDSMFIVSTGKVETCRLRWGRRIKLESLGEGEFFGEMSVLTGLPRTTTVTAVKNTELLGLTRANLEEIFARHPELEAKIRRAYEDRILDNRRRAVERRIALGGGEFHREEGIRFFDGSRMLRLRKIRSKGDQLLGQVKHSPGLGDGASDGSWETRPSWLVQVVRVLERNPQEGRDDPTVAVEPAHQLFANLSSRRETAKSAKNFTSKFGPLLWEGHYYMEHRPVDRTETADEEGLQVGMVEWSFPLSRFWREQRHFQFLFRLGVVMSPNNAAIEGGWSRQTPPPAKSRAELLKLLIENLEAFPEITRRFVAIARSEDNFEPRSDRSEKDTENVALSRCWLEALEKEIEESKGSWTDKEYTTWLTVADAVLEILTGARNRCLRESFDAQEGWITKTECASVLDALYFLLAQDLLGNNRYRFCRQCDGIYRESRLDEITETCGPKCAMRLEKRQLAKRKRAERRRAQKHSTVEKAGLTSPDVCKEVFVSKGN